MTVALLVIAVVIALLFPALSSTRTHCGPRTNAASTVRNIVNAVRQYEADYGHLPRVAKPRNASERFIFLGDPSAGCAQPNAALFDILRAIPRGANSGDALNPKRAKYFEAKRASDAQKPRDGFADGPAFAASQQGCLFDDWGGQYCIVMETDGDGRVDIGSIYKDLAGEAHEIRWGCVAMSFGKDRLPGGENYRGYFRRPNSTEAPDDIVSWQ